MAFAENQNIKAYTNLTLGKSSRPTQLTLYFSSIQ